MRIQNGEIPGLIQNSLHYINLNLLTKVKKWFGWWDAKNIYLKECVNLKNLFLRNAPKSNGGKF